MRQFFRTPWAAASIVAAIAVLTACNKTQPTAAAPPVADKSAPPPVATVNGTPISRTEYDIYVKSLLQGKQQELTPEQKAQVLDELINMQLLSAVGDKDGLEKDPDTAAQLKILHMRVLADAESQKFLKGQEPTDTDMHAEYETAIASMDKTEYHARHILVASKDQAVEIIKKLKGGAKFDELAKTQSTDGSKTNGGDLGWFSLARMVKPFGDAVKTLKKGEYTQEPVQTQFGWHIIKLEDTREVTAPPFDQVKPQITNAVIRKKLQAYVADLKKNAKIEKNL
ncbi:MAG TPA: peptidylprolyl isomerase [Steroidobacteraceae bacterium]|jgi:peptidyl-prolyl cis-trans isomerase C|nr:peptidylprolyl isomerase [Steroidobacteraceae bacterium]